MDSIGIAIAIVNIVVITGCASTQYGQKNKITTINSDKNQRVAISSSLETSGRVCIEAPPFTKSATATKSKVSAGSGGNSASLEGSTQRVLEQHQVLEIIKSGYYFACQDYLNGVFHARAGKVEIVDNSQNEAQKAKKKIEAEQSAAMEYLDRVRKLDNLLTVVAVCQPSQSASPPKVCNDVLFYNALLNLELAKDKLNEDKE